MLIHILILLLVYGLVFAVIYWAITQIPLPAPFAMVARVILALVAVILIINLILPLAGEGPNCPGRLFC